MGFLLPSFRTKAGGSIRARPNVAALSCGLRPLQPLRKGVAYRHLQAHYRPGAFTGMATFGASLRAGATVGETLFGLTSLLPTKVTPSSMTSLAARISPNSSVLALMSILSLAITLPVI